MAIIVWRQDLRSCWPSGAGIWREPDITDIEAAMLEKHDLEALSGAVSEAWKNVNFTKVNGLGHADGTGCLYHVRSTTVARACNATATIARCGNLV
jgi:hypothetical protein